MKKHSILLLSCLGPSSASHANLIINGDFSSGNVGITNSLTYRDFDTARATRLGPTGDMWDEVTYTNGANPFDVHALWIDVALANNPAMIINGPLTADNVVWSQQIAPTATGTHRFSFDMANTYFENSTILEAFWTPDGGSAMSLGTAESVAGLGVYQRFDFNFSAVAGQQGTLSLVDLVIAASGNDIALDNIYAQAVPEPATLAVLGLGLLATRRRRH